MDVRQASIDYVRAGLVLVPVPLGSKGPRGGGWHLVENCVRSEADCERITGNVGLAHAYSRTAAIDFDDYSAAAEWLSAHDVSVERLFNTNAVQISSGRENRAKLLYKLPDNVDPLRTIKLVPNPEKPDSHALELRCASREGLTVHDILPPSIHPDTHRPYEWRGDWRKLGQLPSELLELWRAQSSTAPASPRDGNGKGIHEGGRNARLTAIGGALRRQGMNAAIIQAALETINERECKPPLPQSEVATIAKSVSRYAATEAPTASWASLSALMGQSFSPVQWAIDSLVPEGVSLLVGAPKVGKSWLALQWALAVSGGVPVWGGRAAEKPGDVLYLGLEDNDRRMQRRVRKLRSEHDISRIDYATTWPRMHEGGVEAIGEWLGQHPGARLVVIDTLGRFRAPESTKGSAYAQDYAVGAALKPLADQHQCAIVMLHHQRKAADDDVLNTVSGTAGLAGSVDALLMLRRERGAADACLYVTGRDIEREKDYAMAFDDKTCLWSSVGTVADAKRSGARNAIMVALRQLGASAPKAIAKHLGKNESTTRRLLQEMLQAGEVREASGLYTVHAPWEA